MAKTKSKRRYYSPEFKRDAVQLVEQGDQPLAAVARTLGITPAMLGRWKQELTTTGEDAFPGQGQQSGEAAELTALRRRVHELEQERDILKKAAAYFARDLM
jgi:transposase